MICEKCKVNIPNIAKFCPKCGVKVKIAKVQDIQTKKCPSCGAENPLSAKFCKVDGYQFQQAEEGVAEKSTDVILCPKCGTENRPNAKFCKKDGAPLGKEIKLPSAQPKFRKVSPPKAEGVRKPSNTWIWVTIVGLVLVLGGVGSYLYFSGQIIVEHPEEVPPQKDEKIVKPPIPIQPSPTDIAKLERDINSALRNRGLSDVYANVNSHLTATLEGAVYDPRDKMLAEKITESFREINEVRNDIIVVKTPRPSSVPLPPEAPLPPRPPIPGR